MAGHHPVRGAARYLAGGIRRYRPTPRLRVMPDALVFRRGGDARGARHVARTRQVPRCMEQSSEIPGAPIALGAARGAALIAT